MDPTRTSIAESTKSGQLESICNPINYTDPTGMFKCSPMPECRDWVLYALVQFDVSGGMFSNFVYNFCMDLDEKSGGNRLTVNFKGGAWNTSAINYKISLLKGFLKDKFPFPRINFGIFAHEIIHQTQTFYERASIWGEAQAFIFQVLVKDELGRSISKNFGKPLLELAFNLDSPGFTTRDTDKIRKVRKLILEQISFGFVYLVEPLLPWSIGFQTGVSHQLECIDL